MEEGLVERPEVPVPERRDLLERMLNLGLVGALAAAYGTFAAYADFVALSSTCPHLGCQVHWEAHRDQYVCPCHNGTFNPEGKPTGGPPKEGNTPLPRYPLEVRGQLVFINVPTEALVAHPGRTQGV